MSAPTPRIPTQKECLAAAVIFDRLVELAVVDDASLATPLRAGAAMARAVNWQRDAITAQQLIIDTRNEERAEAIAERKTLVAERDQLRADRDELLEVLIDMVGQHCGNADGLTLNSNGLSANEGALEILARFGKVRLVAQRGGEWIAGWSAEFLAEIEQRRNDINSATSESAALGSGDDGAQVPR